MQYVLYVYHFRYIPENFYSDFTMADQSVGVSDYLQTVVAGKSNTTTVSASSNGSMNQQASTIQLPISMTQTVAAGQSAGQTAHQHAQQAQHQPITIQLPTQPQPVQGVKTVTYVNPVISKANSQATVTTSTASLQPLRVTQYAYTQTGTLVIQVRNSKN